MNDPAVSASHATKQPPVLVLGASSLVGAFLVERLSRAGRTGICTGRRSPTDQGSLPPTFQWRRLDVAAPAGWKVEPGTAVLSLLPLWLLPPLLPYLPQAGQIIALGSTSVFAKSGSADPAERDLAHRLEEAESRIAAFCRGAGVRWTILRPTLIHDGRRDANVTAIAQFIRRFGFFPVGSPASGLRQPIHADDVAAAMIAALDNDRVAGRSIDVPGGETLTYREMVRRVFVALDRPVRIVPLPVPLLAAGIGLVRRVTRVNYSPALFARMNQDLAFDDNDAVKCLGYAARPFRPSFPPL
jgi:nucleoside-diphosphate-sugar epimerase